MSLAGVVGCSTPTARAPDRVYLDLGPRPPAAASALAMEPPAAYFGPPLFLDRSVRQLSGDGGFVSVTSVSFTTQDDRQLSVARGGVNRLRPGSVMDRSSFTTTVATQSR